MGGCKNDQKNQWYGSHDGPHLRGAAPKRHEEEKVLAPRNVFAWMGVLFLSCSVVLAFLYRKSFYSNYKCVDLRIPDYDLLTSWMQTNVHAKHYLYSLSILFILKT